MKLLKNIFFLQAAFGTLLLILNATLLQHPLIGIIGITLYAYSFTKLLHSKLFKKETSYVWSFLSLISIISILTTLSYYAYKITPIISMILLFIPFVLFIKFKNPTHTTFKLHKESKEGLFALILFFILEATLLFTLFLNRTTENSNSPWNHTPLWFLGIYLFATILVIAIPKLTKNKILAYASTILHLFITYAVVVIIYPLGFGFDGFIHRATENWIQANGFIDPKQPVYIGQYSFIVWLSNLTSIPIFFIDTYLVPLLSASILPFVITSSLKNVWKIPEMSALQLTWFAPFIYYLSLHLTTPHNVLILFSFVLVFGVLEYLNKTLSILPLLIISVAGLTIHALLGAPAFLFVLAALIIHKAKKFKTTLLIKYIFGITFLFPILFTLFFLLTSQPLPNISNPFNHISKFLDLFKQPFWYSEHSTLGLEVLYSWQRIIPILLTVFGLGSFVYASKKKKLNETHLLFLFSFIAYWAGAFLMRSWIHFPNVANLEQGDYPMRLVRSSIIFLLPFLMFGFYGLIEFIKKHIKTLPHFTRQMATYSGIFIIGIALTTTFYLAYPQENAKAHFPGYNVSLSDFKASRWIHNDNEEINYIVLANPLTSIAAMTDYGFPKYYETKDGLHSYLAVPTGGYLYRRYADMLYLWQDKEFIVDAMQYTGTKKGYFVVSSFWSNFESIVAGAKENADSWHIIDDGKIWIFTYYLD